MLIKLTLQVILFRYRQLTTEIINKDTIELWRSFKLLDA